MRTLLLATLITAISAAGCDQVQKMLKPAKPPREHAQAEARIEKTIELPGSQGMAHILVVPTGFMEAARCVIVTSPIGSPAVSCTPKDFDLKNDE